MAMVIDSIPRLDLDVTEPNDVEQIWKLVASIFPCCIKESVRIKRFEAGLSNTVLRIDFHNQQNESKVILIRINGNKTNTLVDRWDEIQYMLMFYVLGNKQQLYAIFKNGLIYSYLDGYVISSDQLSEKKYSSLIIDALAKLHSLPTKQALISLNPELSSEKYVHKFNQPCLINTIRMWVDELPDEFDDPVAMESYKKNYPTEAELISELDELEQLLRNVISPLVLCHNDLMPGNIIISPDDKLAHFIDLEYCGFNHAAFDIGNHFCEFAGIDPVNYDKYPTFDYQRRWICDYLHACKKYQAIFQEKYPHYYTSENVYTHDFHNMNGDQDIEIDKNLIEEWLIEVNHFALASNLYWSVWAVIKSVEKQTSFDYLSYGIIRWSQYKQMKMKLQSLIQNLRNRTDRAGHTLS